MNAWLIFWNPTTSLRPKPSFAGTDLQKRKWQFIQFIHDGFQRRRPLLRTALLLADFSRAYNRVWRKVILTKMARKGIQTCFIKWVRGFLSDGSHLSPDQELPAASIPSLKDFHEAQSLRLYSGLYTWTTFSTATLSALSFLPLLTTPPSPPRVVHFLNVRRFCSQQWIFTRGVPHGISRSARPSPEKLLCLHWLRVPERVEFKIAVLTHKVL